jgi:hypothetical protein
MLTGWGDESWATCCGPPASTIGGLLGGRFAKSNGWWSRQWCILGRGGIVLQVKPVQRKRTQKHS